MTQAYSDQLDEKIHRLSSLLTPFDAPALEIFPSVAEHFRMRAEFRVWHEGDDLYYVMFNSETKQKYRVDRFSVASGLINTLMPEVLAYVRERPTLRHRLFQVDFLTTTTDQALISLLYHRPLDETWIAEAKLMRQYLQQFAHVHLIGRARKQKHVLDQDFVVETLTVDGQPFHFEHIENSFTQPNATINCEMIQWARSTAQTPDRDLLELYCGNGNFSLPLANNFRRVLGTEISRSSVESAKRSIQMNKIQNVVIERLSAEECSAAIQGSALPNRLAHIDLRDYDFSTVLVDPPRAGLDAATIAMISQFDAIIYISCNPETLASNLSELTKTHRIERTALFDQFPFTHHIEAGVYLTRRVSA